MAPTKNQGRTPLMAGNWKMNLDHLQATHLVQKLAWTLDDANHDVADVEVAVLPPFTDLRSVQTLVDGDRIDLRYGAQDVSAHDSGAYTGEVSGAMLAKLGCTYVIVGHSERREHHAESDAVVAAKAAAAHRHGLIPIVCVGEGLEIRQAGTHVEYTVDSLRGSLDGLTAEQVAVTVIAYEPVWAIGTGEVATPSDAQEVCAAVRASVSEPARAGRRRAGARALRRLGQVRQRRRDHGRGRRGRCARRRREPRAG